MLLEAVTKLTFIAGPGLELPLPQSSQSSTCRPLLLRLVDEADGGGLAETWDGGGTVKGLPSTSALILSL